MSKTNTRNHLRNPSPPFPKDPKKWIFFFFLLEIFITSAAYAESSLDIKIKDKSDLLNEVTVVQLQNETPLASAEPNSPDRISVGYGQLLAGKPRIETEFQTSQYDFTDAGGFLFEYSRPFAHSAQAHALLRTGYFRSEQTTALEDTVLHVIPLNLGTRFLLKNAEGPTTPKSFRFSQMFSPYAEGGLMGLIQVQRGLSLANTSLIEGFWATSLGTLVLTPWDFAFQAAYSWQFNWARRAEEWSGQSIQVGLSIEI